MFLVCQCCGRWRVQSVRLPGGGEPALEYLRVAYGDRHVADVATVEQLRRLLAGHGIDLSELIEHSILA